VVDISTDLIVTTIPLNLNGAVVPPWDLAMTPDQRFVYVTETGTASVQVIDTTLIGSSTSPVVATIPVGVDPYSIAIAPNGNFAYVTNIGTGTSGTVSVISLADNTVVATVPVGFGPFACAVTQDSTLVYVTNLDDGTISVIDAATNTVTSTFSIAAPLGIAFAPAGTFAYVADFTAPGTVTALAIPSNKVTATIGLGSESFMVNEPIEIAFTPDGTSAYVTDDNTNDVSVINTSGNTVTATVVLPSASVPFRLAITPDGSQVFVGNFSGDTISVIQTSNNTVSATIPMPGGYVSGVAIASAAPTSQTQSQPLSPTQPTVFNFGTNSQTVQYPAGTNFSNVVMNTVAQQITQAEFHERVSGTKFSNATCIVYEGNGGNCVDYMVTCTNPSGSPITCPSETEPSISVETAFNTSQEITNPCYLTTPIGTNEWENIFVAFFDPKVKGKTKGFSEFVACNLGAANTQGLAEFTLLEPTKRQKVGPAGRPVPIEFQLKSAANGKPVTDAEVNLSVMQVADANGNPVVAPTVYVIHDKFVQNTPGVYSYSFCTTKGGGPLPAGTYSVSIYGNAFAAHVFKFELFPLK
jgi:YVTN family beta-propeller protein